MKLPKRIADITRKKQDFIDAQRTKMQNSVIRMQSQLLSDLIADIVPELDTKDGKILETVNNYKLISRLDKTYKDFQASSNSIIFKQIVSGTKKIEELSIAGFKTLTTDLPERFDRIVEATNKRMNLRIGMDGGKVIRGGYLESFFNSASISTELKQMTSKAITSGLGLKDYTKQLREMIVGSEESQGGLERQFARYAYDLYQEYDSSYNLSLANEFEYNYFVYMGELIEDSRDFCAAHVNKVWTREEAETWATWTPADGEYPPGWIIKQKNQNAVPSYLGYPGYDPIQNRGGYNCQHNLKWIPDILAFDLRPDLKK